MYDIVRLETGIIYRQQYGHYLVSLYKNIYYKHVTENMLPQIEFL